MSTTYIPKVLRERVIKQARRRCGYCLTQEKIVGRQWRLNTSFLSQWAAQQKRITSGQLVHSEINIRAAVLPPLILKVESLLLFLTRVVRFGLNISRGLLIPLSLLA